MAFLRPHASSFWSLAEVQMYIRRALWLLCPPRPPFHAFLDCIDAFQCLFELCQDLLSTPSPLPDYNLLSAQEHCRQMRLPGRASTKRDSYRLSQSFLISHFHLLSKNGTHFADMANLHRDMHFLRSSIVLTVNCPTRTPL